MTDTTRKRIPSEDLQQILSYANRYQTNEAQFVRIENNYAHFKNTIFRHQTEMKRAVANTIIQHAEANVKHASENAKLQTKLMRSINVNALPAVQKKKYVQDSVDCF